MDAATRTLERQAVGQPNCARLLVALGRTSRDWRGKGLGIILDNGWTLPVGSLYPLFDGSGWAILTTLGTGLRVDDPRISEVFRA